MTVATTTITAGPYTGNNLLDTYAYGFKISSSDQLIVYETDDEGAITTLILNTDYTVTGVGNPAGGTVVRTAGNLPTDYKWYIRSNFALTQSTNFSSQGAFFPAVHEAAIDKLTMLVQQLEDRLKRAVKFADNYSGTLNMTLPTPVAGDYLRWKGDLSGLENNDQDRDEQFESITWNGTVAWSANQQGAFDLGVYGYGQTTTRVGGGVWHKAVGDGHLFTAIIESPTVDVAFGYNLLGYRSDEELVDSVSAYETDRTTRLLSYGWTGGSPVERFAVNYRGDAIAQGVLQLPRGDTFVPANASATGTKGDITWDSTYVYVCVATNTWKRAAIATW